MARIVVSSKVGERLFGWIERRREIERLSRSDFIATQLYEAMIRDEIRTEADRITTDPDAIVKIMERIRRADGTLRRPAPPRGRPAVLGPDPPGHPRPARHPAGEMGGPGLR